MFPERRKNQRREYSQHTVLPLRDHQGGIVMFDRRNIPERRLNNIEVDYIECSEYLEEIFKNEKPKTTI